MKFVLVALLLVQLTLAAPVEDEIIDIEAASSCGGGCSCSPCSGPPMMCKPMCMPSCCRKPTPIFIMPMPIKKPVFVPVFVPVSCCSSSDQSCCNSSGGSSCCNSSNQSCCGK